MSLACYCAKYDCTDLNQACGTGVSYPSCGLISYTVDHPWFGPWIRVFDSSGTLVGVQRSTDFIGFFCPSDQSLSAFLVRAGRFPDSTCTAVDGGLPCPQPDAGAGDAHDAATPSDASCSGPFLSCVQGSAGGNCSDAVQVSECVGGKQVCPGSTIPLSQCACVGLPPPGCTCSGSAGVVCTDGGPR